MGLDHSSEKIRGPKETLDSAERLWFVSWSRQIIYGEAPVIEVIH